MTIFKLTDLTTPVTRAEWLASIYAVLARLEINTTAWGSGAVTRTMAVAASACFAALSELQAEGIRGGFLEYARGPWLRIKARFDYGVEPDDATFATGELVLTNTGGGLYEVDAGDLIVKNTATGKAYRNVASFELGALATVTITIIALEAGAASNANAGAVTDFVTQLARVECVNPTALIARDAESPAEIRARCSEKLGSLSPLGPWDAYAFAARTAKMSTGESAGVTRSLVTRDGYGNLYLHIASGSGAIGGTVGDLATPIGAVDDAVGRLAEPLGVTAHVVSAVGAVVTVAYQAWVWSTSGLTADGVRDTVAAALRTFISTHPIGGVKLAPGDAIGRVYVDTLRAVIHNALPEIFRIVMVTPSADVELTASQVPVLLHDPTMHAVIHVAARPEGTLS